MFICNYFLSIHRSICVYIYVYDLSETYENDGFGPAGKPYELKPEAQTSPRYQGTEREVALGASNVLLVSGAAQLGDPWQTWR